MLTAAQNHALTLVADVARVQPTWAAYAAYCAAREQGLRKTAFQHLASFLAQAEHWTLDQRIAFVGFLFPFIETVEAAGYGPLPQPLSERLVKPTLLAWCAHAPQDTRPFRWYGSYYHDRDYLLRALELDPADDAARETLLGWWLHAIYYAVHELPTGLLGNPADVLALGDLVREHIRQLTSPEKRAYWTAELEADLELVHNYSAWRASGHPDLVRWGSEQGKLVAFTGGATYYYQS